MPADAPQTPNADWPDGHAEARLLDQTHRADAWRDLIAAIDALLSGGPDDPPERTRADVYIETLEGERGRLEALRREAERAEIIRLSLERLQQPLVELLADGEWHSLAAVTQAITPATDRPDWPQDRYNLAQVYHLSQTDDPAFEAARRDSNLDRQVEKGRSIVADVAALALGAERRGRGSRREYRRPGGRPA